MLKERFGDKEFLRQALSKPYKPFPDITDRKYWESIPDNQKETFIRKAKGYKERKWEVLPLSVYLDFYRNGDRKRYEDMYFERREALGALTFAECIENNGEYIDAINDLIWMICEETSWNVPAHNSAGKDGIPRVEDMYIDLFAAETASTLASVLIMIKPVLEEKYSVVIARVYRELEIRIADVYLAHRNYWWMGYRGNVTNNWNPWINSNCLFVFLTCEQDEDKRLDCISKSLESVDFYISTYPEDGGCDEGPGYWSHACGRMFMYLEFLYKASEGKINAFDNPKFRNMGSYIYKAYIADSWFLNFADAPAKQIPSGELIKKFGARTEDNRMVGLGDMMIEKAECIGNRSRRYLVVEDSLYLYWRMTAVPVKEACPYVRDAYLPGIQVMTARQHEDSAQGVFFAAKGGHNDESHNHNDIGSFVLYKDGKPVIIDVGVETYCKKTFSDRRYEIWTMQSDYHNLPKIGDISQKYGRSHKAQNATYYADDDKACFSLNMALAYDDDNVKSWVRRFEFHRTDGSLDITEEFELKEETSDVVLHFMTICENECMKDKICFKLGNQDMELKFDEDTFEAVSERIDIQDERLRTSWPDHMYRTGIRFKAPVRSGKVTYTIQ